VRAARSSVSNTDDFLNRLGLLEHAKHEMGDSEGRPVAVVTVDVADDLVQTVRAIANPDKLRHLGTFTGPSGPNA
jgi:hypothetical protein